MKPVFHFFKTCGHMCGQFQPQKKRNPLNTKELRLQLVDPQGLEP